jgi:hypothetical protein
MEEKYKKLFNLSQNDLFVAIQKLSPDQLDYKELLDFLRSPHPGIKDGVGLLLLKHFLQELEYETLLDILGFNDSHTREKEWSLLDMFIAQELDPEVLLDFLRSPHPEVRYRARLLLLKYFPQELTLSFFDDVENVEVEKVLSLFA